MSATTITLVASNGVRLEVDPITYRVEVVSQGRELWRALITSAKVRVDAAMWDRLRLHAPQDWSCTVDGRVFKGGAHVSGLYGVHLYAETMPDGIEVYVLARLLFEPEP